MVPRRETAERRGGGAQTRCEMCDDLDDGAAAVLELELLSRTERVEGMPLQPMSNSRTGGVDLPEQRCRRCLCRVRTQSIPTQRRRPETAQAAARVRLPPARLHAEAALARSASRCLRGGGGRARWRLTAGRQRDRLGEKKLDGLARLAVGKGAKRPSPARTTSSTWDGHCRN